MRERDFQRTIIEAAEALGWMVYHNAYAKGNLRSRTSVGFPDLILVHSRYDLPVLAWEIKVGRNKPTEAQRKWLHRLEACSISIKVITPDDWEYVKQKLKEKTHDICNRAIYEGNSGK